MKEATFSVALVRNTLQYAAAHHSVDPQSLCAAIGIDPGLLETPDSRINGEVNRAMWREVMKHTGDDHIGLHLGEAFNPSAVGILGYVLFSCQTLSQVFEKLSRYMRLFSQGVYIHCSVSQGQLLCDCDIVAHLQNYLLEEPRQPVESTFAAILTAVKLLTGKPLYPYAVWFQHPRPADSSEHQRIFQSPVHFAQPTNRLIFDASCLEWAVLSANSTLLSVFEQHAETMLNDLSQHETYTNQVVRAITEGLKGEIPSVEAIAHHLAISVRHLQRELKKEGTSYQQLLDRTRNELAIRYLKKPDIMIDDIAFLLGFSEPSAFHRAFKRWTGKTPRSYRLLQRGKI
ncbi:AraC family transcriptional regulator [Oculatella sp. LEGE 06141]|nr:AraC family transcriptional regulator [Oculatella sp. LEGE 06141]